jgi:hypothetical protein
VWKWGVEKALATRLGSPSGRRVRMRQEDVRSDLIEHAGALTDDCRVYSPTNDEIVCNLRSFAVQTYLVSAKLLGRAGDDYCRPLRRLRPRQLGKAVLVKRKEGREDYG